MDGMQIGAILLFEFKKLTGTSNRSYHFELLSGTCRDTVDTVVRVYRAQLERVQENLV